MEELCSFIQQFHLLFQQLCEALVVEINPVTRFPALDETVNIFNKMHALCKFIVSVVPPDVKFGCKQEDLKVFVKVLEKISSIDLVDYEVCH